jgi:hypothetical protein
VQISSFKGGSLEVVRLEHHIMAEQRKFRQGLECGSPLPLFGPRDIHYHTRLNLRCDASKAAADCRTPSRCRADANAIRFWALWFWREF